MRQTIKTVLAAGAMAGLAACATVPAVDEAETRFTPPPVGTEIDWQFIYGESDVDLVTSRIVATGDDFVIYNADTSYPGADPYDYFVEFSGGLFYASCDGPMPDVSERETALALWPLADGGGLTVTGDFGGDVAVGKSTSVMVGDEPMDVVWTSFSYVEDGETYTDKAAVSTELGTVVEMRWDDGSLDLIREIRLGDGTADLGDIKLKQALGGCADLLGAE